MATKTLIVGDYGIRANVEDSKTLQLPGYGVVANQATVAAGRIMSSLAAGGGLAGHGGIAGPHGGLAR